MKEYLRVLLNEDMSNPWDVKAHRGAVAMFRFLLPKIISTRIIAISVIKPEIRKSEYL